MVSDNCVVANSSCKMNNDRLKKNSCRNYCVTGNKVVAILVGFYRNFDKSNDISNNVYLFIIDQ